jgi:hypothetical protein
MMDEADTHRLGFRIRALIGRGLASCLDAWDRVRPPDAYERWMMRPVQEDICQQILMEGAAPPQAATVADLAPQGQPPSVQCPSRAA